MIEDQLKADYGFTWTPNAEAERQVREHIFVGSYLLMVRKIYVL